MSMPVKPVLTRSNIRDIVLLASFFSAIFCDSGRLNIIIGFSFLTIGCFGHIVSKGILVRNVVLSRKGIYSFVRHPYYLSNYLIDIASCVLSGNPYLLLAYPFLFFWAYGPTLRKEESFLLSAHETAFVEHNSKVPQVFPDGASFKHLARFFESFSWKRITLKEYGRIARFMYLNFFILLINRIKKDGWVDGLWGIVQPTLIGYNEFVLAFLVVVLCGVSHLLLIRARRASERASAISGSQSGDG